MELNAGVSARGVGDSDIVACHGGDVVQPGAALRRTREWIVAGVQWTRLAQQSSVAPRSNLNLDDVPSDGDKVNRITGMLDGLSNMSTKCSFERKKVRLLSGLR